jgi:hypothetical protein
VTVLASTVGWIARSLIAVVAAVLIYAIGASFIRKLKVPADAEPDPDEVVPVSVRFRCVVCGAEVTMTAAQPGQEPDPPRHCREDMVPIP